MFAHASKEKHGFRWWWHFGRESRRCLGIEFSWWTNFCHAEISVRDDGWKWALALPPLAIWISFDGFPAWKPQRKCVATWDGGREFWLTDQRECGISIHDWTIRISPWAKWGEWCSRDPWWVRGVSLNIADFVLGRTLYTHEKTGPEMEVSIPMPEGWYLALFTPQRQTWKRPRWFGTTVRESFDIRIPKGIPFAGKGENSWDCGDDGLFGMSADGSVQEAVSAVRTSVMESRKRYGSASDETIKEALA